MITRSRDGSRVLLGEANISDARMLVYDPKEGVVSRQEWYEYNVSGFNSGRQAYSLEAGTAVQILGSNVHVYDALLTYRFDLAALHSRWAYGGLEMAAFDETGRLYVIDSIADEIVEISPATGAILRTIALGFDLQPAPEHLGNHLLVGPGSRYFTVITSNGLRLVANPHETGLVVGSDAGDTLSGTALPDTLEGRGGDDSLAGGAGVDTLRGEGGNDTLDGGLGSDTMIGGVGNDIYILESLDDAIVEFEGEGTDEVRTALGSRTDPAQMYTLAANVENLTGTSTTGQGVFANDLNNVVTMGAGGDLVVLDAGGNDLVSGGGGDDYLYWGAAFTSADKADGGLGFDTVGLLGNYALTFDGDDLVSVEKLAVYSSGNAATPNSYSLTMHDGNVAVGQKMMVVAQSLAAGEALTFNGAAETDGSFNVRGGRGADTITGGAKADTIWGGLGADTLRGGAGGDVFEYGSTTESKSAGADVIMDFEKGDKINLTGIDADGDAANGDSKFTWLGAGAFTGHAGELRVSQHPQYAQTWVVQADTNGDKQADLTIYLVAPAGFLPEKGDFYV
ncbi:MAG TPA: calcium-binding protein [Allosphingosinicella sp.]